MDFSQENNKRNHLLLWVGWLSFIILLLVQVVVIKPYFFGLGYGQGQAQQQAADIKTVNDYLVLPGNQIETTASFVARVLAVNSNSLTVRVVSVGRNPLVNERPETTVLLSANTTYPEGQADLQVNDLIQVDLDPAQQPAIYAQKITIVVFPEFVE